MSETCSLHLHHTVLTNSYSPGPQWSTRLSFSSDRFEDKAHHITYKPCTRPCEHPDGLAIPCHIDCTRLVSCRQDQLLPITALSFEPRSYAREGRLRDGLAHRLAPSLPRALPLEVNWEVSQYLIQQYSTTLLRSLAIRPPGSFTINISLSTVFRYANFEGISYACHAENQAHDDADQQSLIRPTAIYVAQGPWGIVDIYISYSDDNKAPPPTMINNNIPDTWWTRLSITQETASVTVHTDVGIMGVRSETTH